MNTKHISDSAFAVIEQYKNVPYFNNKSRGRRAGLAVEVGKGSPKEIHEELKDLGRIQKMDTSMFDDVTTKRFLVENDIGIDCSGFAYYVLNEESQSRGKGSLDRHISPVGSGGIIAYFSAKLSPVKNISVITFADEKNSKAIMIKEVKVGDIITMVSVGGEMVSNHILIINQVEYQNFLPTVLHYVHAMAWPTDGEYGHGIHTGEIDIVDLNKPLIDQRWIELENEGEGNYTFMKAKKTQTELRRLKTFLI